FPVNALWRPSVPFSSMSTPYPSSSKPCLIKLAIPCSSSITRIFIVNKTSLQRGGSFGQRLLCCDGQSIPRVDGDDGHDDLRKIDFIKEFCGLLIGCIRHVVLDQRHFFRK